MKFHKFVTLTTLSIMIAQYGLPLTEVNAEETLPATTEPLKLTEDLIEPAEITPTEGASAPQAKEAAEIKATEEAAQEQAEPVDQEATGAETTAPASTPASNQGEAAVQAEPTAAAETAKNPRADEVLFDFENGVIKGLTSLPQGWNGDLIIPAEISGQKVSSIANHAFFDNNQIKTVTFAQESQLTQIGDKAFESAAQITSVDFSNCLALISIGTSTFSGCYSLTSVKLPTTLTSIGDSTFYFCNKLTSINLANCSKLTEIGELAFYACSKLTSIELPASLESIRERTFDGCDSLKTVTLPADQLTSIRSYAFRYCSALEKIITTATGLEKLHGIMSGNAPVIQDGVIFTSPFNKKVTFNTSPSNRQLNESSSFKMANNAPTDIIYALDNALPTLPSFTGLKTWWQDAKNNKLSVADSSKPEQATAFADSYSVGSTWEDVSKIKEDMLDLTGVVYETTYDGTEQGIGKEAIKFFDPTLAGIDVPISDITYKQGNDDDITPKNAGNYEVTLVLENEDKNTEDLTLGTAYTITPYEIKTAEITFENCDKAFDDSNTANLTAKFTPFASDTTAIKISDATYKSKGIGSDVEINYDWELTDNDAGNYELPTKPEVKGNITNPTIDQDILNKINDLVKKSTPKKVYDGNAEHSYKVEITSAFEKNTRKNRAADQIFLEVTGEFASKDAGKRVFTVKSWKVVDDLAKIDPVPAGLEATGEIKPKEVNGTITAAPRAYDGTNVAKFSDKDTLELAGLIDGEDLQTNPEFTGATYSQKDVGENLEISGITADILADGEAGLARNYTLKVDGTTAKGTITPYAIPAEDISFNGMDKEFDNKTASNLTASFDVLARDDAAEIAISNAHYENAAVGKDKLIDYQWELVGDQAGNYTLPAEKPTVTGNIGKLQIDDATRAEIVEAIKKSAPTKVYDSDAKHEFDVDVTKIIDNGETVSVKVSGTFDKKNVGERTFRATSWQVTTGSVTLGDLSEFTVTGGEITAKPVTVTYNVSEQKEYDGTPKIELSEITTDVFLTGDDVKTVADPVGTLASKNVGLQKVNVKVDQVFTGADLENYAITFSEKTCEVTPKTVTPSFTIQDKVYDGTTTGTVEKYEFDGAIEADELTLEDEKLSAEFQNKHAGTDKDVSIKNIVMNGADVANYKLATQEFTAKGDITPKAITIIEVKAVNRLAKTGDKSVTLTGGQLDPAAVISGDELKFTLGTGTISSDKAGTYDVTTDIKLAGADKDNYRLTQPTDVKVTITEASSSGGVTTPGTTTGGNKTTTTPSSSKTGTTTTSSKTYPKTGEKSSIIPTGFGLGILAGVAIWFKKKRENK